MISFGHHHLHKLLGKIHFLPEQSRLLSHCIPVSNPVEVPQEAADHVEQVQATHHSAPPPMSARTTLGWNDY